MDHTSLARQLVESLGGKDNILACNVCMTRLRLTLSDIDHAQLDRIRDLEGVLGVVPRSSNALEVVFGPGIVADMHSSVLAHIGGVDDSTPPANVPSQNITVEISPARKRSYAMQAEALSAILGNEAGDAAATAAATRALADAGDDDADDGPRVLVINGPNINLLGLREPDVYGEDDYDALIATCRAAALKAGFSECRIYQSNHEGDLIDRIQRAHGRYDGIIINAGAYTHTSIALLDALQAVKIPAVEVHISKVSEREDFRQVSYVGMWCFKAIIGHGIAGYEEAMFALADELRKGSGGARG